MTLYKNISETALLVHGFFVKAGDTIEHELIENPNFSIVSGKPSVNIINNSVVAVSSVTKEDATIKDENKEIK